MSLSHTARKLKIATQNYKAKTYILFILLSTLQKNFKLRKKQKKLPNTLTILYDLCPFPESSKYCKYVTLQKYKNYFTIFL